MYNVAKRFYRLVVGQATPLAIEERRDEELREVAMYNVA